MTIKLNPSLLDTRDYLVSYTNVSELPMHVDLLPDVEEVENQLQTNSCTANAAASALEISYKRAGKILDFSRLFIYWFSRQLSNITGDNGAYPRDMCKALQQNGTCLETTWEFVEKNIDIVPSDVAIAEAEQYKVLEYARLNNKETLIRDLKATVAAGIPVLTSIKVSESFNTLGSDWKQHDWNHIEKYLGNHEVVIIGYNDAAQRFLAQNSWGNRWGDGGFFGIPYEKIGNNYYDTSKAAYEYWILSKLNVPYIEFNGKETDPYNINEIEKKKSDLQKNIIFTIIFGSMIAFMIMMFAKF